MVDAILLVIVAVLAAGWTTWMSPDILRYLATRMWARAHAIDVAREQYRKMVTAIEPPRQKANQNGTEEPVHG